MNNKKKQSSSALTKKIALSGIFLAVIATLSMVEQTIPPLPFLPANVKLGLSNVITMYCVYFIGKPDAIILTVLKSLFVLLMRGVTAGFISLTGGLLSIFFIIIVLLVTKKFPALSVNNVTVSIIGAVMHNLGQICAASVLLDSTLIFLYFPALIISGIIMGAVTGTLLNVILPVFKRVFKL